MGIREGKQSEKNSARYYLLFLTGRWPRVQARKQVFPDRSTSISVLVKA
jgi:hypothetical protein